MAIITDPDDLNLSTEVILDTDLRTIELAVAGNLSNDGVTMAALYSFFKILWKDNASIGLHPFPVTAIDNDAGKYVVGQDPSGNYNGWRFAGTPSRKLIRNGGWSEYDDAGVLQEVHTCVLTLGTFEDSVNDNAYYAFGTDKTVNNSVDFDFAGPVNEAVSVYLRVGNPASCNFATSSTITRASGSFIADGYVVGGQVTITDATDSQNDGTFELTAVAALELTVSGTPFGTGADSSAMLCVDNRNAVTINLRVRDADPFGKRFAQADLSNTDKSALSNYVVAFPLSNAMDVKIAASDASIGADLPYTEIRVRFLSAALNKEVDSTTKRDFGIVIDVGSYTRENGATTASSALLTSANLSLGTGEALADYAGGTVEIYEGADQGTYTISGTPVNNAGTLEITLTTTLSATASSISFSMFPASPVTATKEEVYEKVSYLLRQTTDINESVGVVVGRMADSMLRFAGEILEVGSADGGTSFPVNPMGGGSGVLIVGFDINDINNLLFYDNTGTSRVYPFVSAGTISFNTSLIDDPGPAEYKMFFTYTERVAVTDLALSGASGSTASIDSAGGNLPSLAQNDYVRLSGFANSNNNGIWKITDASPSATQADATKVDGKTVANASAASVNVDLNPIDSPDGIVVNDSSGTPIAGDADVASVTFDFDYDGNTQGGRTAGEDAAITIRAIGLSLAQYVQTTGVITRATGLNFQLQATLERNYTNP
jgi:hypothetical protein